jgi:hypothetical protein
MTLATKCHTAGQFANVPQDACVDSAKLAAALDDCSRDWVSKQATAAGIGAEVTKQLLDRLSAAESEGYYFLQCGTVGKVMRVDLFKVSDEVISQKSYTLSMP